MLLFFSKQTWNIHLEGLYGFLWKTAFRRYILCHPQWPIICTRGLICLWLKDSVQNCNQWLFTKLFSDYNKKKILVRKTALRIPKADLKLSWNRGSLKDNNNSQDATWIKENKLPQDTFLPNLTSTNVHSLLCSNHLSYKVFHFITNHLVVPKVPWELYVCWMSLVHKHVQWPS